MTTSQESTEKPDPAEEEQEAVAPVNEQDLEEPGEPVSSEENDEEQADAPGEFEESGDPEDIDEVDELDEDEGPGFWERYGIPREAANSLMTILAAVACAIGVIMVYAAYRSRQDKKAEEGARALHVAQDVTDIKQVLDEHGSKELSALAELKLAQAYYGNGNFAEARASYERFLAEHPEHPFVLMAEMGLLVCTESEAQFEAALQGYKDFQESYPESYLAPEAMFGQGRCLEQLRRKQEAKQLYEQFLVDNPDSLWVGRAERALEQVTTDILRAKGEL